jgi:hypothetical protein
MDQNEIDQFAETFQEFLELVVHPARERATTEPLADRIEQFLGADPVSLPVVSETFEPYQHPTVQLAIDAILGRDGVSHELVGTAGQGREHMSFAEMLQMSRMHRAFGVGAVDYVTLPVSVDEEMTCVRFGLYLIDDSRARFAILLRGRHMMGEGNPAIEVIGQTWDDARRWLAELRTERARNDKLRGQVLAFVPPENDPAGSPIRFYRRPELPRDDVILPGGVLERIERQVIGIAEHRRRLTDEDRHLKRGVLLYGPPGTGKTHTVRYLTGQLTGVTVVLLAGPAIGFVSQACELARSLQPAVVVLEDVDLIAEDRSFGGGGPLLYTILDQMDGLAGDADVCFLLTTNREDLIETALAQRPGRVDLAVEVPLPDDDGRARLLALYGSGIELTDDDVQAVVEQTEGVPASFIKELSRRATMVAVDRSAAETTASDLREALAELLADQHALTRRLLGVPGDEPDAARPDVPAAGAWFAYGARPGVQRMIARHIARG